MGRATRIGLRLWWTLLPLWCVMMCWLAQVLVTIHFTDSIAQAGAQQDRQWWLAQCVQWGWQALRSPGGVPMPGLQHASHAWTSMALQLADITPAGWMRSAGPEAAKATATEVWKLASGSMMR